MNSYKQTMTYFAFLLIVITTLFSSCTQEITFREPALQANKDSAFFWLSFDVRAYPLTIDEDEHIFIEATNGTDKITFQLNGMTKGSRPLGSNDREKVTYTSIIGANILEYTTGKNRGNGSFIIKDIDSLQNAISGEFYFEALKTNVSDTIFNDTVKFTRGVFHKIPVR